MDKVLDEALSRQIAQQIGSKAKTPFDNAYKAALATREAVYVQGFVVLTGKASQPLEHAWIELSDRRIDPHLPHLKHPADKLVYYPAQQLTVKQLKEAVDIAREDYPDDDPLPIYGKEPYDYYGDVMLGGQEYSQAYAAAIAKYKELADRTAETN